MKPPLACLVTWPTSPSGSAALDAVSQPHSCALIASHVHTERPHTCLCGATLPARDREDAK